MSHSPRCVAATCPAVYLNGTQVPRAKDVKYLGKLVKYLDEQLD